MVLNDVDKAFVKIKELLDDFDKTLTEADTREKIIDPIFKECLGWDEDDIRREKHVDSGYLDYIFSINNMPMFVIEAKRTGIEFTIPISFSGGPYIIGGTIWDDGRVRTAIVQARSYAVDIGAKYAIVTNGVQFLIFEAFRSGPWKEGKCIIFNSYQDLKSKFVLFWNILSKNNVLNNSLQNYLTERKKVIKYTKPLEFFNYREVKVAENKLASILDPFIRRIFGDIIDETQIEILENCYVKQQQHIDTRDRILPRFDPLPHYSESYGIENFFHIDDKAGKFQLTFEESAKFLRRETPEGSTILLLGGVGSGKTTFINHFFRIILKDREDVLWFYVNFKDSPPDPENIEDHIYQSIIEEYELKYETKFKKQLKEYGFENPKPIFKDVLTLFSFLTFQGYNISLILDNVDQHSLKSPQYQERSFLVSQNLTKRLKTITILTLREESFFKSRMSGVFNAYNLVSNSFHITSPRFEQIVRTRINYTLKLLALDDDIISKKLNISYRSIQFKEIIITFFKILNRSLSSRRKVARDILRFIDEMSGGDMRVGLELFTIYMMSGNTEIDEMLTYEFNDNPDGDPKKGYRIPFHHIIKSIILKDSRFYSMGNSQIMNIYDINPEYTDSHFINLRILDYLSKRINYYSKIGNGYVSIPTLLVDAQISNHSQKAIEDSIIKMAKFGLIGFDNHSREGFNTANYLIITQAGMSYLSFLKQKFVYLDLMWGDTPISDAEIVGKLRMLINVEKYEDDIERIRERFKRTEIFIEYLKRREEVEWSEYPQLQFSYLSNRKFMDDIITRYDEEKKYILKSMIRRYAKQGRLSI